ncbi:MAG TPA: hypothetical protein VF088_00605 [Pyrinomonadaceae bacterium]
MALGFRNSLSTSVIAIFVLSRLVLAQIDSTPKQRLRSPASVRGFIGGESHDSYVIHATKGHTMTVKISWRKEGDNRASFTITESPSFFESEAVEFGKTSEDDTEWTGKIPKTGDYYIYVVAHPTAHYKLTVIIGSGKNKKYPTISLLTCESVPCNSQVRG